MTARDFSVMPVQVWNADGTPADSKPLERAVRRKGRSLNAGSCCDVEFGAMRCPNPDCPWWQGPNPVAMDLSSESKKPN